ncbi:class I SAM-dependent methyltransferase [Christiangramia aquimixticola]|uniref:class I SAM-dependent methyltransferase n=1 Tax=Christiangramia aquimixticola TaxID=1697558 RepID=UPI003AA9A30E
MDKNKDIFGTAIKAFYNKKDKTPITVHSPHFDDDEIPVEYLFRKYKDMPLVEQKALDLCKGEVLDVGCGAGSHALYLQEKPDLKVSAIDTSEGAIEVALERGVKNAQVQDFFKLKDKNYDSILLLMNGSGIIGKLDKLDDFLNHCKELLNEDGIIIMDSSDLIYLFDDEFIDTEEYYGELEYTLSYKDLKSDSFDWLYLDPETLIEFADKNGFNCEIVTKGEHYDFLAVLKRS